MPYRALLIAVACGLLALRAGSGAIAQQPAATPGGAGDAAPLPAASAGLAPVLGEFVREVPIGTDPLSSPAGVAVDAAGTLYVINGPQDTVRVFDREGAPIAVWGESGPGPGQFAFRAGSYFWGDLALGPDGNLYVLDPFNSRVQVFRLLAPPVPGDG